jgi:S1-C subfamily serine protease
VAKYRPGDKISVEYIRDGKVQTAQVQLKNKYNTVASVDNSRDILDQLGSIYYQSERSGKGPASHQQWCKGY